MEEIVEVTVDQDKCVGSGQCVLAAKDIYDQRNEDGIMVLGDTDSPVGRLPDVRHAAVTCPALAIAVEDDPWHDLTLPGQSTGLSQTSTEQCRDHALLVST
jgi:ferredoxin